VKKIVVACLSAGLMLIASTPATAAKNLIVNGDFEQLSNGPGQVGPNTIATGWTTNGGYNFVYAPNTADTVGSNGAYGYLKLWGPNNGSNNGFTATSPTGGNFYAADGAFGVDPIKQTVTGLEVGKQYVLSFDWAGAQQYDYTGPTTEQWHVSFGNETQSTEVLQNASHGFTGWRRANMTFTAQSTSAVLSFLAEGTPEGKPPFSLLDGVSLTAAGAVPEPASWAMMIVGFGAVGSSMRRRRMVAVAA
jgi:hypothetical protein